MLRAIIIILSYSYITDKIRRQRAFVPISYLEADGGISEGDSQVPDTALDTFRRVKEKPESPQFGASRLFVYTLSNKILHKIANG